MWLAIKIALIGKSLLLPFGILYGALLLTALLLIVAVLFLKKKEKKWKEKK